MFKFTDYQNGTVPAYIASRDDVITTARVAINDDGVPCDSLGIAIRDDGKTRDLVGWPHIRCQSYNYGSLLVPLRESLQR